MAASPNVHVVTSESLGQMLRNRMGLILGPSATHSPGFLRQLSKRLSEVYSVSEGPTVFQTADAALDRDTEASAIRLRMREFVTSYSPIPELPDLARIPWSAVLSFCFESAFDNAFQQDANSHATRRPVAILADPFVPLPPRNTPVAKLLGSIHTDEFSFSTATYKRSLSCTSSNQSGPLRLRRKRDFPPLCRVVRRPLILSPSCS